MRASRTAPLPGRRDVVGHQRGRRIGVLRLDRFEDGEVLAVRLPAVRQGGVTDVVRAAPGLRVHRVRA